MRTNATYILTAILGLGALTGCAKSKDHGAPAPTPSPTNTPTNVTTNNKDRLCLDNKLTVASNNALSRFFDNRVIRNIEGDVTYCLDIYGSGSNLSSAFRIEYEDDFGITSFDGAESIFYRGSLTQNGTKLNMIFMDSVGLIRIAGTGPANGNINATISFYNFPSYNEAINSQLAEMKLKCKSGEWTVAKCLGYGPPTMWWDNDYPATLDDQINAILKDASKMVKLGTMSIDLQTAVQP